MSEYQISNIGCDTHIFPLHIALPYHPAKYVRIVVLVEQAVLQAAMNRHSMMLDDFSPTILISEFLECWRSNFIIEATT